MNWFERTLSWIAPAWALARARARITGEELRHFEAASRGRRTSGWKRSTADATQVTRVAATELRIHARDLCRNNGYAISARREITKIIGWGTRVRTTDERARAAWEKWAGSTECDAAGLLTFAGIEALCLSHIFTDGEVLVRFRVRRPSDGLTIPLQLQVLEADYLDEGRDTDSTPSGGRIVRGVEYDALGRRAAYWIFDAHPGSSTGATSSKRIPASEIHHAFAVERAGQGRGVSWLGAAIVDLKDLSDYDSAELVKQKIAACFAAFVTDTESMAGVGKSNENDPKLRGFEPGMIQILPAGKDVKFATPPNVTDAGFTIRNLRRVAASIGITYEAITNDYSQVNFSSARMGRLSFLGNVTAWHRDLVVPFATRTWAAAMGAFWLLNGGPEIPKATWTPAPLPMIEPDKEALANQRRVRGGMATFSEILREQGYAPVEFFKEYAEDLATLKQLGIKLDSNVADVSQAGLTQERAGIGDSSEDETTKVAEPAAA